MSDEKSPAVTIMEAHEEFVQHIEQGSSKIRALSAITIFVAFILLLSYAYQLLLPFISNTKTVVVNLADPVLQATEATVALLALLWLYVGIRDYLFTRRMDRAIKEARLLEKEIEKGMIAER